MFETLNFAGGRDNQNAVTSNEHFFILQRYDVPTIWYEKSMFCFENCSFSMVGLSVTCFRPTK